MGAKQCELLATLVSDMISRPRDLMTSSRRQIATYLFLVLLFSSVFYFLMIRSHALAGAGGYYAVGIMWCPALAAFATLKMNGRSLSELGWKWPAARYAFASWFLPLAYTAVAYLNVWMAGLGGFPNPEFVQSMTTRMGLGFSPAVSTAIYVLLVGSFGMARGLSTAVGEEIGWRGFLVPELSKNVGFTATAVISGIVWAVWHYPILIFGDYNAGTATWYALACFTVMVVSGSFIYAWMRLKSGSLWTGALLHASHNLYVQAIFTPLTSNTGKTAWYIDEFGAVIPLISVLIAVYFWARRGEIAQQQSAAAA
jgi:uncharacterized protein